MLYVGLLLFIRDSVNPTTVACLLRSMILLLLLINCSVQSPFHPNAFTPKFQNLMNVQLTLRPNSKSPDSAFEINSLDKILTFELLIPGHIQLGQNLTLIVHLSFVAIYTLMIGSFGQFL